jgi:hypothetical protein
MDVSSVMRLEDSRRAEGDLLQGIEEEQQKGARAE